MSNRKVMISVKIMIVICGLMLQYYFCAGETTILNYLNAIIAIVFWVWLSGYVENFLNTKPEHYSRQTFRYVILIITSLSSLVIISENVTYFRDERYPILAEIFQNLQLKSTYISLILQLWLIVVAIASTISLTILLVVFWNMMARIIYKEIMKMDEYDKRYFIIGSFIITISIAGIYLITRVFHDSGIDWDVVYRSDTGFHVKSNVWMTINNQENDIRQPLFAVFAMPFAALAKIISYFLGFIPNAYAIVLNILQAHLLMFAYYLLAKLIDLKGNAKIIFLLFINFSYSSILFYLNMEQYQFAVFYLLLGIYLIHSSDIEDEPRLISVAATGTLITSGLIMLFPEKMQSLKLYFKSILSKGLLFLGILAAFGRIGSVFNIEHIQFVLGISSRGNQGKILMKEKILQYMNFVKSIFVKPDTIIENSQYNMAQVQSVSTIGIIILIIILIGFIVNYKTKFARVCCLWVLLSTGVLIFMGWGAHENGMILYSLYFGWAYISLIALLMKKIFYNYSNNYLIRLGYIACGFWGAINIVGISDLVKFGIRNFYLY